MSTKKLVDVKARPGPVDYTDRPLSEQVRELIGRASLSQRQAAHELGVTDRMIRYWRSGDQDPPRMAILALERLVETRRMIHG